MTAFLKFCVFKAITICFVLVNIRNFLHSARTCPEFVRCFCVVPFKPCFIKFFAIAEAS